MKCAPRCRQLVSTGITFGLLACSGTDNLTDPVVTSRGNTSVATGGTTSSAAVGGVAFGGQNTNVSASGSASGGTLGTSTTSAITNAGASAFDWGAEPYDASKGALIAYQNHFNGMSCVSATCHVHTFHVGGTVYLADGVTPATNVQIGLFVDGVLSTTYAGTQGNFYSGTITGTNWSTAQIALRTSTGTVAMPVHASASGDCNTCHDATHRITAP
jgi:hypothetical protein